MTAYPARPPAESPRRLVRCGFVFLGCATIALSGCSARRRPAIPWATAIEVRPEIPTQTESAGEAPENALPDLWPDFPDEPPRLITVRGGPARPHVSMPLPSAADVEKPEPPLIAPQFSAEEGALAEEGTKQSIAIAEKNLKAVRGRSLNASQADLASKIRGFLKDAREAAQAGDWMGARGLAKKAQVLSEELVGSL